MTDGALMQRVRDGDAEAFGEIVDRYKDPLVNYLTWMVRSRDRAEEIAQEAFVRLYDHSSRYRNEEKLGAYLYRIATNLVVSAARREKRWGLLLPRLHASSTRQVPSPDEHLLTTEIQREVAAALEQLPVKFRAPLLLFEMDEWSYEEIAAAFELPVGTVKSRISRGRELLRRRLAPWWIGGHGDERRRPGELAARAAAREGVARIHS